MTTTCDIPIRTSLDRVPSVLNELEISDRGEAAQREFWRERRGMVVYADKVPTLLRMLLFAMAKERGWP